MNATDNKILKRLQNDGRISNSELAEAIGLSPSPCLRRVKTLERQRVISRYVAIVDAKALGFLINAFVNVSLQSQEKTTLESFQSQILDYSEVMECYLMTGDSDYLLRVVVADLSAYERFLMDHLTRLNGVASIKSSFALKQVKYRTALPLSDSAGT